MSSNRPKNLTRSVNVWRAIRNYVAHVKTRDPITTERSAVVDRGGAVNKASDSCLFYEKKVRP